MAPSSLATPASVTPDQSRRPSSVRTGQDDTEDARPLHLHLHQHQHHQNHGSHPTSIAALAATAVAAAAGSPSPGASLPIPAPTATMGSKRSKQEDTGNRDATAENNRDDSTMTDLAVAQTVGDKSRRVQLDQERNYSRLLQEAITELCGVSTSTSRRLDIAYGSVLSRLTALRGTVLALRSLAVAARATNRRFMAETQNLASEIEKRVDAFDSDETAGQVPRQKPTVGTPSDQQRRLVELHDRVRAGRKSVLELSDRVDAVRLRVDSWGLADRAWQERTHTRLKVLWLISSSVILVLAALLFVTARYSTAWGGGASNTVFSRLVAPVTARPTAPFSLPFLHPAPMNETGTEPDNPLTHLLDELYDE